MRLFLKSVVLFCIPLIFLILVYIWADPFKVIYDYPRYLSEYVMLNRGFVSTEVFLKNNHEYKYNSFVFGSSRSMSFNCSTWSKYLPGDCSTLSYGNWNESIEGVLKKVQLIDSKGNDIKNAIIVIDADLTFSKSNRTLSYDHYLISGKSPGQFHLMYLSNWFRDFRLVLTTVDYKLFRTKRSYMKGFIGMKDEDINPVNNDWFLNSEREILKDSTTYYTNSLDKFYARSGVEKEAAEQISPNDSVMMQKINSVFKNHGTNVKVIIGPLYDQISFNKNDLKCLQKIFGQENIYDYTGVNDLTNNKYNYMEDALHYRYRTGDKILKRIYNP
jgi:hypothetical protein